jgi:putative membrane protein
MYIRAQVHLSQQPQHQFQFQHQQRHKHQRINLLSLMNNSFPWIAIWILFWVFLGLFMSGIWRWRGHRYHHDKELIKTPMDILKERYAKGEINKQEFEEKKKDIA